MSAKRSGAWLRLAQVGVTVGLMGLLLRQVEWSSLPLLIANLHWGLVVLSIGLLLFSHLANVARWQYLLQHWATGYRTLLVFYGAGLFNNNFLPTGFGGDGVRAALLSRRIPLRWAIFSVGLDRGIGLIALSALLGIGLWIGLPPGLEPDKSGLVAAFSEWKIVLLVLFLAAAIVLLSLVAWHRFLVLPRAVLDRLTRVTKSVTLPQWTIGRWFRLLTGGYVVSVLSHLCIVAAYWTMLQAVGIEVLPGAAVWLVLAVTVSLLFPIAINGLGVQEATYVVILSAYGITSTSALLPALLTRLILVVFGLVGGAGWLLSTQPAETIDSPSKV